MVSIKAEKAGKGVEKRGKAEHARKPVTAFGRLSKAASDQSSGEKTQVLATFAPGSRVTSAALKVSGKAFAGKLRYLKGAKVTPSPVAYDTSGKSGGTDTAFIVDFTGIRSVMQLGLDPAVGAITLVLPWLGTDFSGKAAYPVTDPVSPGQFLPRADASGDDVVAFTGVETMKLLVQVKAKSASLGADQFADACLIASATYPSNVKASINGRLPFWSHPGVLNDTADATGLADDLNALLKDATGPTEVKLLLTTDAPGVLQATFEGGGPAVESTAEARWGGQASLDVALAALEAQAVALSFPAAVGKTWQIERLALQLSGRFPPWRVCWGQASSAPGKFGMKVSAQFSVARRFVFAEDGELHGVALLLRPAGDAAELKLELVPEQDDQPGPGRPLASADLSVPARSAGDVAWHEALFPSPVKMAANQGIWLVAKARTGSAEWAGGTEAQVLMRFSREGGQWQRYPLTDGSSPVAQIKLLRRPFAQENQPLLDIVWGGQQRSVEVAAETLTLELSLPSPQELQADAGGTIAVPLSVTARASGSLTIKSATAFYREKTP